METFKEMEITKGKGFTFLFNCYQIHLTKTTAKTKARFYCRFTVVISHANPWCDYFRWSSQHITFSWDKLGTEVFLYALAILLVLCVFLTDLETLALYYYLDCEPSVLEWSQFWPQSCCNLGILPCSSTDFPMLFQWKFLTGYNLALTYTNSNSIT